MEYVCNANFRGEFEKPIDLQKLHEAIPKSKLYTKPHQLVIRDECGTLILFRTGKFRTMGCNDELQASLFACSYLEKLSPFPFQEFPFINLQSYTLKCQLGYRLRPEMMALSVPCVYEPELFPALRLKQYNPASVNFFVTGKETACGLKDPDALYAIIYNLKPLTAPYRV